MEVSEGVGRGAVVARVHATDPDQGPSGTVRYGLAEYTEATYGQLVGVNNRTGEVFLKAELDYERQVSDSGVVHNIVKQGSSTLSIM